MKEDKLEAIALLEEECGEVIQAVGKLHRHGPYDGWKGITNIEYLSMEVGDVLGAIKILKGMNVLDWKLVEDRLENKFGKGYINKWLHNFEINPEWFKEKI